MSMLDKFRKGAQKAGQQASIFIKDGSQKLANESHNFVQGFSLPGEADKAAKTLASFLGQSACSVFAPWSHTQTTYSGSRKSRIGPQFYTKNRFATGTRRVLLHPTLVHH